MSLSTQKIKEMARDIEYAALELDRSDNVEVHAFRTLVENALFTVSREAYEEVTIPGD